jgi:hypothetical protein
MSIKLDASEKLFQSAIIQIALLNGWQMFHATPHQVRPGVFRSDGKGYPDLTLAHETKGLIYAEIKTTTGKASKEQLAWLKALAPWAEVYIWRPADIGWIEKRLSRQP